MCQPKKKTYTKPQFTCHGDIRCVTLAGSPGAGESGNINTRKA